MYLGITKFRTRPDMGAMRVSQRVLFCVLNMHAFMDFSYTIVHTEICRVPEIKTRNIVDLTY